MLLCSTAKAERTVMEGHPSTNSSITVSSTTADVKFGGTIEVTSSATASAFFGDGSHLSGINGTVGISSSCAAGYFLSTGTWVNGVLTGGGCMPAAEPASCTLPQVLTGTTATGFTCQEPSNVTGNAGGTASNVTGTVAVANGGTSATTSAAAAANLVNGNPISPSAVYAVSGANVSTMTPTGIQTQNLYVGSITANYTPAVLASNNGYPQLQLAEPSGAWTIISENNYTPGDLTFSWQSNERFRWNYNGEFCNGYSGPQCLRSFGDGVFSGSVGVGTPTPAATLSVNGNFSWGTGPNISTGNADGSLVTASSVTINTGNADGSTAKVLISNWPGVGGWSAIYQDGGSGIALNFDADMLGAFTGNSHPFTWINSTAKFYTTPVEISSGTLIVDGAGAVAAIGSAPAPGAALTVAGVIQASSATFTAISGLTQCLQADASGHVTGTGSGCGSSSGNMGTTIVNNMASGSAINFLAGSSGTVSNGGLSDVRGGANYWIMVSSVDYALGSGVCPSSVSWNLSNYLQPWEASASSITWRVHEELAFSSNTFHAVLSFNNDTQQKYTDVKVFGYNGTLTIQACATSASACAYAVPLNAPPNPIVWGAFVPSFVSDSEFSTSVTTTTLIIGKNDQILYAGTAGGPETTSGVFTYSGAAPLASVSLEATTESPLTGSPTAAAMVPMCGHYELWRKGFAHK